MANSTPTALKIMTRNANGLNKNKDERKIHVEEHNIDMAVEQTYQKHGSRRDPLPNKGKTRRHIRNNHFTKHGDRLRHRRHGRCIIERTKAQDRNEDILGRFKEDKTDAERINMEK